MESQLAPILIFLYLAVAAWVAFLAHRTPGYGVETDLLTDFAPAARGLLAGRLEPSFYVFHGFGYPALLALFSIGTGGDFFLAAKLLNLASCGAGLWFAYALFRDFGGRAIGLFVLLGLSVNPSFWTYVVEVGTDMPAFALLMGATYGALRGRSAWTVAAAGAAAGFAYITRYNAISVLLASLLVCLARRRMRLTAAYLAGAVVPVGAWLVANTAITGHPFANRNYLNIAFAVYGRQTQWDQFWTSVGAQFHSLGEVIAYDPAAFLRGIVANLGTHWLRDATDLLPIWLGVPAILGVAFLWGRRPGWRGLAVHFALAYLVLGIVFYNVRFFLYLLPFYLAGVAVLLFPARAERENRIFGLLARLPHARHPQVGWTLAAVLLALSAWRAQATMHAELAKDPLDVRLAGETLRRLGPRDAIVMTRKPHVPFYAGMRQLRFPTQGSLRDVIRDARAAKASYVLYSGMEASLRPDLLLLMEPDVQLPGFHQIDRQVVDNSNYFAIYRVSLEPVDSAALDSGLVAALVHFQSLHKNEAVALYDVGSQLLDMGRTREAVEQLVEAQRLQPDLVQAAMLEAAAQRRLGEFEAARVAARRARTIGATPLWMESELGQIELAAGRDAEARAHLEKALAIEPTNVATLRFLAQAQERSGDAAGSKATLARIATLSRRAP